MPPRRGSSLVSTSLPPLALLFLTLGSEYPLSTIGVSCSCVAFYSLYLVLNLSWIFCLISYTSWQFLPELSALTVVHFCPFGQKGLSSPLFGLSGPNSRLIKAGFLSRRQAQLVTLWIFPKETLGSFVCVGSLPWYLWEGHFVYLYLTLMFY